MLNHSITSEHPEFISNIAMIIHKYLIYTFFEITLKHSKHKLICFISHLDLIPFINSPLHINSLHDITFCYAGGKSV